MDIKLIRIETTNMVKVIKTIRDITGMELAEAKETAENLAQGVQFTISGVSEEYLVEIKNVFNEIGVVVELESSATLIDMKDNDTTTENREIEYYKPIVDANSVSNLSREQTLKVLAEAKIITANLEYIVSRIEGLKKEIPIEEKKAEDMRSELSSKAKFLSKVVYIITIFVFIGMLDVIGIIVGLIVGFFLSAMFVEMPDNKKHEVENNNRADEYIKKKVAPLKSALDEYLYKLDVIYNGGQRKWVVDVVGEEMFSSVAIDKLYKFVQGRRADTIKEALIRYDDEEHKARMEAMQRSIKEAAEVASNEAIRQTQQMEQIARNSAITARNSEITAKNAKKTASAARASALFNAGTYLNTRDINRKL